MHNLKDILNNNKKIKKEIAKYSFGSNPFIDDSIIRGGFRIVRTIKERNSIDCCHRKLGMKVMVIGQDHSFKEYTLQGEDTCKNENWVLDELGTEIGTLDDGDITLLDNYDDLDISETITTQQDLNRVLSTMMLQLIAQGAVDKHYVHSQTLPSDLWIIEHNLDKRPSVTVVDSANTVLLAPYRYINDNKIEIKFNGAFSGKAYLN